MDSRETKRLTQNHNNNKVIIEQWCVCVLAAVFSGCEINNNLYVVDLNCLA